MDTEEILQKEDSKIYNSPLNANALKVSGDEKVSQIIPHFKKIMEILGLDTNDDSLSGTPKRVAKMYVKELFRGLNPSEKPNPKTFSNKYKYGEMLVEKNIEVVSACEHHFLPMLGNAHVAYISTGEVIGLSKMNRIVDYYSRRPQVQERLTVQILQELKEALKTEDVAVLVECKHMCVTLRGTEDKNSTTITSQYSGKFLEESYKKEFLFSLAHSFLSEKF